MSLTYERNKISYHVLKTIPENSKAVTTLAYLTTTVADYCQVLMTLTNVPNVNERSNLLPLQNKLGCFESIKQ